MPFETWIAFALVWIAFAAFPGPNAVYAMAIGSRRRRVGAIAAAGGFSFAVAVYVTLVAFGLIAFLAASAAAFEVLKWIGVGYLFWLAWQAWHADTDRMNDGTMTVPEAGGIFSKAAMISLTNPKSALAYVLVYPPFLNAGPGFNTDLAILGATSVVLSFLIYTVYGAGAGYFGHFIRSHRQALIRNRCFAAVFAAGGAALAFTDNQ
ncbi:MAG: LysE family translocator [Rhodospirillaceae bacterium]|nr:LysE family translocator [Rhodospirillaceae bacterium]MBT5514653.1 LysE family translocator [Rhodospirillaceae bacterium]MBT6883714.1 LysE family translocator [Rhodospirillaceae bacterium]MBT7250812.1 LysE family translocator [Rhodospirillaceae bacterium]MBT7512367.1 LysE family translocator [Rhodospirillaceae bacterium]